MKTDSILGVNLIVLSTTFFVATFGFAREGVGVGPQFFPRILAMLMIILSVCMIVRSILHPKQENTDEQRAHFRKEIFLAAIALIALVIYAGIMNTVGYVIATLFYMSFMLWLLGERSTIRIGAWALGVTFLIYWVFQEVLSVPLPGLG